MVMNDFLPVTACPGRPGGRVPPGGPGSRRHEDGARPTGRTRDGKMFSPAGTRTAPAKPAPRETARGQGKDLCPARGERSERPVAGTATATHADQAGRHTAQTAFWPTCQ